MEVIARKVSFLKFSILLLAIAAVLVSVVGIVLPIVFGLTFYPGIVIVAAIVVAIIIVVTKLPKPLLTYKDGMLKCAECEFSPKDIVKVEYTTNLYKYGVHIIHGDLDIILSDRTIKLQLVSHPEKAQARLNELMKEAK